MFADAGNIAWADGQQSAQTNVAKQQAEDAAGEREQHAFREQLQNNAPWPGSHRRANGELALAAGSMNQKQIGDVRAGNQQHQAHRAQHHQQRRARITHNRVTQRLNLKSVLRSKRIRVAAAELIGCNLQQGVGLGDGYAGLETPGSQEIVPLIGAVGIELKGKQNVRFGVGDKRLFQDPDDGIGLIAQ